MWDTPVAGPGSARDPARLPGVSETAPARERSDAVPEAEARAVQWDTLSLGEAREESPPSLWEQMADARKKAEEQRKRFRIKQNPRYGDAPMEAYARLSRARTQGDVSAAAGYARRRLAQLKTALRQDGDNADRIKAAMGQLQKAILRAGRKKNDLLREDLAERRRETAQAEDRRREAQRLANELQRRRAQRAIRESGYFSEAAISDRMAAQMAMARAAYELSGQDADSGGTAPSPAPAVPDAAAPDAAAPMPDAASFSVQA